MKENKFGRRYCKIVFTGAPCSGKTTALDCVAKRISTDYSDKWRVFKVAEASSFLYQGGVQRSEMNENRANQWQEDIIRTIIQLEDAYEHIAELEEKRNVMIICDRGCMDPKVFTKSDQWDVILEKMDITEEELINRYKCVLQLFTAPEQFYNQSANPHRRENHEQSKSINEKYSAVWRKHKYLIAIKNREDATLKTAENAWKDKFEDIFTHIRTIMEEY